MFILVPKQNYHKITEEEEDVTVALVSLDIHGVLSVDANLETGNAIINYKSGERVVTLTPFVVIFSALYNNNFVALIDSPGCKRYFKPIGDLLTKHEI